MSEAFEKTLAKHLEAITREKPLNEGRHLEADKELVRYDFHAGWQAALTHDRELMACGHPRGCWKMAPLPTDLNDYWDKCLVCEAIIAQRASIEVLEKLLITLKRFQIPGGWPPGNATDELIEAIADCEALADEDK